MSNSDNSLLISDALLKTNPDLAIAMDVNNSFRWMIKAQGARVDLYRDYERGEHRAVITTQMRKMLRLETEDSGINDFNGNYCGIIIDKMAGRLHVNEITTGDAQKDDAWLVPLLEENDWDNIQSTTFRGAIRDADSYIMVDPSTLKWTSEPAYDGFAGLVCIFETGERTPMWACKIWSEAVNENEILEGQTSGVLTMRLVVYQPNKISYWYGRQGSGEVMPDKRVSTQNDAGIFTINEVPFPVGKVPIVHFANRYENYSETGESEIRAAIPLQDIYNRTLHSMVSASEFSAFRIAYSIGMEMDVNGIVPGAVINLVLKDAKGNLITEPTPEMLSFLQTVKVGQFSETNIGQYVNQLDKIVREISQVTQTPIYGITTNDGSLSGEALKQLEIGLLGKIYRFQSQNTDAVKELIELTADIQNAFNTGKGSAPLFDDVALTWKSPEILDTTSQITALSALRTNAQGLWSDDWYRGKIGGLLGMSQSEIQKEADAVKKESAAKLNNRLMKVRVPVDALPQPQNSNSSIEMNTGNANESVNNG